MRWNKQKASLLFHSFVKLTTQLWNIYNSYNKSISTREYIGDCNTLLQATTALVISTAHLRNNCTENLPISYLNIPYPGSLKKNLLSTPSSAKYATKTYHYTRIHQVQWKIAKDIISALITFPMCNTNNPLERIHLNRVSIYCNLLRSPGTPGLGQMHESTQHPNNEHLSNNSTRVSALKRYVKP